jgi:hypothetical protein
MWLVHAKGAALGAKVCLPDPNGAATIGIGQTARATRHAAEAGARAMNWCKGRLQKLADTGTASAWATHFVAANDPLDAALTAS